MEHIAAFMLLIACSDDFQACTEEPAPAVAYETLEQCELELSPAIRMSAARHDKLMGQCVEIDPALFYEDAEIVWDVTKDGEIEVAIELINPDVNLNALAGSVQQTTTSRYN